MGGEGGSVRMETRHHHVISDDPAGLCPQGLSASALAALLEFISSGSALAALLQFISSALPS